jgi:hypothetical protein
MMGMMKRLQILVPNKTNIIMEDKVGEPRTTDHIKVSEEIPGSAASNE